MVLDSHTSMDTFIESTHLVEEEHDYKEGSSSDGLGPHHVILVDLRGWHKILVGSSTPGISRSD